jgi:hypothetical protein
MSLGKLAPWLLLASAQAALACEPVGAESESISASGLSPGRQRCRRPLEFTPAALRLPQLEARREPPRLDATVVRTTLPSRMVAGSSARVSVTMLNSGRTTWSTDACFVLYSRNQPPNAFGVLEVEIPAPTPRGSTAEFDFVLQPEFVGQGAHRWQMYDGRRFFGELVDVPVIVEPAPRPSTVVFSDTEFALSDWSADLMATTSSPAAFQVAQVPSGGDPGAYRYTVHTYAGGNINVRQLYLPAAYEPARSGAIRSLDYSYDVLANSGRAVEVSLLLVQGGVEYWIPGNLATFSGWSPIGEHAIGPDRFSIVRGIGPTYPDFSSAGPPIQFGVITSNSGLAGGPVTSRDVSLDNWRVVLSLE